MCLYMVGGYGLVAPESIEDWLSLSLFSGLFDDVKVNGCTGKMGRAVLEASISAGLQPVSLCFSGPEDAGKTVEAGGKEITVHGPSDRENILSSVFEEHPNLIVVDYTVPAAVNGNAELYSKVGVPFVMGTTGGDREKLYKTVADSKVYAVISPQMGKQVVAFLAAMEIMAEQFPGAFSGYSLQVMESHQASKLDTSGTAKAVISCFEKLGVSFNMDEVNISNLRWLRSSGTQGLLLRVTPSTGRWASIPGFAWC
ncbi:4-hydroxy-tetrahydrodipicolinate reductase 1, chloroplastic [Capsicum annuum]|nr:4-hydroxy-tetrahydrodipicolinate reductase 1, chloroplastic [Capsicum annuum]